MGKKLARVTQSREKKIIQQIRLRISSTRDNTTNEKCDLAQMFGQNKSAIIEISKNDVRMLVEFSLIHTRFPREIFNSLDHSLSPYKPDTNLNKQFNESVIFPPVRNDSIFIGALR